jgi:hypothetical protein
MNGLLGASSDGSIGISSFNISYSSLSSGYAMLGRDFKPIGASDYCPVPVMINTSSGLYFKSIEAYDSQKAIESLNKIMSGRYFNGTYIEDKNISNNVLSNMGKIRFKNGIANATIDLKRMADHNDTGRMEETLRFYSSNLYGEDSESFCPGVYRGAANFSFKGGSLIDSSVSNFVHIPATPVISVRNAPSDFAADVIVRGVPFPMAKTQTSINADGTFNLLMRAQMFLLGKNGEFIDSVECIRLRGMTDSVEIYAFSDPTQNATFETPDSTLKDSPCALNSLSQQ